VKCASRDQVTKSRPELTGYDLRTVRANVDGVLFPANVLVLAFNEGRILMT